jgi:hypothetical protein
MLAQPARALYSADTGRPFEAAAQAFVKANAPIITYSQEAASG